MPDIIILNIKVMKCFKVKYLLNFKQHLVTIDKPNIIQNKCLAPTIREIYRGVMEYKYL